ncbi:MAG TPA: hypothetical protein VIJ12_05260, partial [Candidatus Baltobacteraceae bacterium]
MNSDGTTGAIIVLIVIGGPLAVWLVSRYLAHNEYMAMISHGMTPPPDSRAWRRASKEGWVPPPAGAAPPGQWNPPGYDVPPPGSSYDYYHAYAQRRLSKGIMVAMVGLALYLALGPAIGHGFGWGSGPSLPGLIVMFVGLAQIISAVLAGASFGPPTPPLGGPPTGDPRSSPFGQSQAPPPPSGSPPYGWRPGSLPEIE